MDVFLRKSNGVGERKDSYMDLSEIDFLKCDLDNIRGRAVSVKLDYNGDPAILWAECYLVRSVAVRAEARGRKWLYCVNGFTETELDQLRSICAKVDAFIAAQSSSD